MADKKLSKQGFDGPSTELTKKEFEQKLLLYQLLKSQADALNNQLQNIGNKVLELNMAINVIDEIEKLKGGEDIFVPIGAGSFISAKINKTNEVFVSLGADVISNKSLEDAKTILNKRTKEFENAQNEINRRIHNIAVQLQSLGPEVEKLASELKE